ncbi:MAG: hypothetical protein WAM14_03420 [Candidatus Nitrosopolaris sp.]
MQENIGTWNNLVLAEPTANPPASNTTTPQPPASNTTTIFSSPTTNSWVAPFILFVIVIIIIAAIAVEGAEMRRYDIRRVDRFMLFQYKILNMKDKYE